MTAPSDAQVRAQARLFAPELTPIADAQLDALVTEARAFVSVRVFGSYQLTALGRLVAHAATVGLSSSQGSTSAPVGGANIAGGISSVSDGAESYGFGAGALSSAPALSMSDSQLATTVHGRQFLALRQTRQRSGVVPRSL